MAPDAVVNASGSQITAAMRRAARRAGGGWLFCVDPGVDVAGQLPACGYRGAWRISIDGEIGAEFRANPEYRPSPAARGWPSPTDDLDKVTQLAAAGYATLDDVAVAFLGHEVGYATAANGSVAVDDRGWLRAYSHAMAPSGQLTGGARWQRSTGRMLALLATAASGVIVNPGPWEALLPSPALGAWAGGEASGDQLADRVDEFLAGELDHRALHAAFCSARVFCQAGGERPGFAAVGDAPGRFVPVFTSLRELAGVAGQTAWFATTGQDVLDLLPDAYDVVIDAGTPRATRLERHAARPLEATRTAD